MTNTFGNNFKVTTWGESHGKAIGLVIDGIPPKILLDLANIKHELSLRRPGRNENVSERNEPDEFEILSGLFENQTTGAPLSIIIYNTDAKSKDYKNIKDVFRPGHADATYTGKYGIYDYNGGGRSSARETAARVIAGAIAKQILKEKYNTEIYAELVSIGTTHSSSFNNGARDNKWFTSCKTVVPIWQEIIDNIKNEGNSLPGKVRIIAKNPPKYIGNPVYNKINSHIAHGMMSINGVKSVTFGNENILSMTGKDYNDSPASNSNNSGGIIAGITNGNDIDLSIIFKPTSTIKIPQETINHNGEKVILTNEGRHDPCIAIRGVIVAEAMLALSIIDYL